MGSRVSPQRAQRILSIEISKRWQQPPPKRNFGF